MESFITHALSGPAGIGEFASSLGISPLLFALLILAVSLWSIVIKGFALWRSARNRQKVWFVALLLLNTLGALEIFYLLFFRKDRNGEKTPPLFTASGEPSPNVAG